MNYGELVKQFLKDDIGIEPRTQFYIYGTLLLAAILIACMNLEGADPFNNVKYIAWRAYQMIGV